MEAILAMIDQAVGLRALASKSKARATPVRPLLIAVAGGSDRRDAPLLASNLALCGALEGKRSLVIRADGASSALRLPCKAGASPWLESLTLSREQDADLAVVELGGDALNAPAIPLAQISRFVIVASPDIVSVAEAYKTLKRIHLQNPEAAASVLFKASPEEEGVARFAEQLENMARTFLHVSLQYLGTLPIERIGADANPLSACIVQERPRSPLAKSIRKLYNVLAQ